jgi:hypothetical protein
MKTSEALKLFGPKTKRIKNMGEAFGITRQAIWMWKGTLPPKHELQIIKMVKSGELPLEGGEAIEI